MQRETFTIRRQSQMEALAHTPNPLALAAHLQTGGGVHRTAARDHRHNRRQTRHECRTLEG